MLAEQLSNIVLTLGDFWVAVAILAILAATVFVTFLVAKRVRPTSETPSALADFVKTCLDAIDDSQLTNEEKMAIAEKGAQLLSTFTMEK